MNKRQQLLNQRIKRLTRAGWSQTEIAERCGVSRVTVRGYQKLSNLPTLQRKMVPAGESLALALHSLDGLFPNQLHWGPELDAQVADQMLANFRELHPKLFARTAKYAIEEHRVMLRSAMNVKRACGYQCQSVN